MERKKCRPGSDFESHPLSLFPAHLHQPLPGSHPRRLVVAAEHVHRDNGRIVLTVRQDALVRLALELRVQALDCVGGADRLPDRPGEGIVRENVHARLGEHPRHPLYFSDQKAAYLARGIWISKAPKAECIFRL